MCVYLCITVCQLQKCCVHPLPVFLFFFSFLKELLLFLFLIQYWAVNLCLFQVSARNMFDPSLEVIAARDHIMHVVYSFLQPSRVWDR